MPCPRSIKNLLKARGVWQMVQTETARLYRTAPTMARDRHLAFAVAKFAPDLLTTMADYIGRAEEEDSEIQATLADIEDAKRAAENNESITAPYAQVAEELRQADGRQMEPVAKDAFGPQEDWAKDYLVIVRWVINHLSIKDVKPKDAPSPAAWAWLMEAQSNPSVRADLFSKAAVRLLPAGGGLDDAVGFQEEAKEQLSTLDKILAAAKRAQESAGGRSLAVAPPNLPGVAPVVTAPRKPPAAAIPPPPSQPPPTVTPPDPLPPPRRAPVGSRPSKPAAAVAKDA